MNKDKILKNINFFITTCHIILFIFIAFVALKYVLPFFAPFVFGFVLVFILHNVTNKVAMKLKINNNVCRFFATLLAFLIIGFLSFLVGVKIAAVLKAIVNSSDIIYEKYLVPIKNITENKITSLINIIFPNLEIESDEILDALTKNLNNFIYLNSKHILKLLAKFGTSIPDFFIDFAFFLIFTIYFSYDYDKTTNFIINLFPKKIKNFIWETKGMTIKTIAKYIRSYFLLTITCFFLLCVGFFSIKIKNPIGTAAIVAIFDFVPLIGSGLIIVPWALSLFIMQKTSLGFSLLIMFAIISLLRSFLEAKILGSGLGIHPIATLIALYAGAKCFGILGIVAAPIITPIIYAILKEKSNNSNPAIKN